MPDGNYDPASDLTPVYEDAGKAQSGDQAVSGMWLILLVLFAVQITTLFLVIRVREVLLALAKDKIEELTKALE